MTVDAPSVNQGREGRPEGVPTGQRSSSQPKGAEKRVRGKAGLTCGFGSGSPHIGCAAKPRPTGWAMPSTRLLPFITESIRFANPDGLGFARHPLSADGGRRLSRGAFAAVGRFPHATNEVRK